MLSNDEWMHGKDEETKLNDSVFLFNDVLGGWKDDNSLAKDGKLPIKFENYPGDEWRMILKDDIKDF